MDDAERFWAKVDKSGECWEWTGYLNGGYGQFKLNGKMVKSHRLSYVLHHPLTIDLWEHREICVCHRCDNRKCVNPAHLFLGSVADNNKDCKEKGRFIAGGLLLKGEKHGQSKLTETQVREIRMKYANGGITQRQLALEYGISQQIISFIISRRNWSHI
jgi:hypothetical protein